jgi:DNA-binding transcriptional LysR family regulator
MGVPMLDLDLLRSFVSVVDAGGFTRAGERVHRTQSTVSQQIRRLEDALGRELVHRNGKQATPTEEGERLLSYARRILALAEEARDVVARPVGEGVVRLGIPEDFAAYRLAELLSQFARARPGLRLDVRCGLSTRLARELERGELDLALFKRGADGAPRADAIARWPERLHWVTSRRHPIDHKGAVPLAVFEQGCLYRNRAIHALEAAGRAWHVAYTSPNLPGIQAAVSAGLGVSILPDVAILPGHRVLGRRDGFPPISNTELVLVAAPDATPATRRLADVLAEFCTAHARGARKPRQPARQRAAAKA